MFNLLQWAVEGYATMFREIDAQLLIHARIQKQDQTLSMIVAPVGVGSLTQSILSYYKPPNSTVTPPVVVTVEPDTAATLHKSLKAAESLSITTSPTIMAGLECGTLSSLAWPLLQPGVDISTTISDWECHLAIEYLKKHGVGAGPCGGAALAGLRRLASDPVNKGVLIKSSVVVCICTEGTRPYTFPTPVDGEEMPISNALMVLHMTPTIKPGWSMQNIPSFAVVNYIAQWLEYRDVDVSWVEYGSARGSLVAKIQVDKTLVGGNPKRTPLLLISHLPDKVKSDPFDVYAGLGAAILALAKLRLSHTAVKGDITLAVIPSVAGLRPVLAELGAPEAALLIDTGNVDLIDVQGAGNVEFTKRVKQSLESVLRREVRLKRTTPSSGTVLNALKEAKISACVLGLLGGNLANGRDDNGEETEYLMAKALIQIVNDLHS
jgi:Pyridoxal-phosphate dependent enzyme